MGVGSWKKLARRGIGNLSFSQGRFKKPENNVFGLPLPTFFRKKRGGCGYMGPVQLLKMNTVCIYRYE